MPTKESPAQTAGPYVHIGCVPNFAGIKGVFPEDLGGSPISAGAKGEQITLSGSVIDGSGAPLLDAMVEFWQTDAAGLYAGAVGADPHVSGFARRAGDMKSGVFELKTIKPGAIAPNYAPHITVWIVARGINLGLHTRVYFADDPANETDPILVAAGDRANTMIAQKTDDHSYRFDIHLQGDTETVFLDI